MLGICRFSYLDGGGGRQYKKIPDSLLEERVKIIFSPERLSSRFLLFEEFLLPSIRAQTDQDFRFVILASTLMPSNFKMRLQDLCSPVKPIEIMFEAPTKQNFRVLTRRIAMERTEFAANGQFRIDDDDALAINYVEKVKRFFRKAGRKSAVLTFGKVCFYDKKSKILILRKRNFFRSAGLAISGGCQVKGIYDKSHVMKQWVEETSVDIFMLDEWGTLMTGHEWTDTDRQVICDRDAVNIKASDEHRQKFSRFFPHLIDAVQLNQDTVVRE